jgi:cytochrome c5
LERWILRLVIMMVVLLSIAPISAQEEDPAKSLPDGPAKDLLKTACIQCHALKTAIEPRKSREAWKTTVYDMISRGAQVFPDEAELLIDYLSTNRGLER